MRIVAEWRDFFPKNNLFGGYIGDGVEICKDLVANQHFLKEGVSDFPFFSSIATWAQYIILIFRFMSLSFSTHSLGQI